MVQQQRANIVDVWREDGDRRRAIFPERSAGSEDPALQARRTRSSDRADKPLQARRARSSDRADKHMTDENRFAFIRSGGVLITRLRVRRIVPALVAVVMTLVPVQAQWMARVPAPADGLIVGRVVDTNGRAVAGAVVALVRSVAVERRSPAMRPTVPSPPDRVLTGQDGFFVFRNLPLGNFTLTAAKPGYTEGAFGRRRPGGAPQELSLTDTESRREIAVLLWKHGAITGVVTDEIGEPLIGIAIQSFNGRKSTACGGSLPRRVPRPTIAASIDWRTFRPAITRLRRRAGRSRFRCRLPTTLAIGGRCRRPTSRSGRFPCPAPHSACSSAGASMASPRTAPLRHRPTASASGSIRPHSIQSLHHPSPRPPWRCDPVKNGKASTCSYGRFEQCGYRGPHRPRGHARIPPPAAGAGGQRTAGCRRAGDLHRPERWVRLSRRSGRGGTR